MGGLAKARMLPVHSCSKGISLTKNMGKRLVPLLVVFCLFGCVHYAEKNNVVFAEDYAGYYSRTKTHAVVGKPSVPITREKDDFIDVDDNKALRKTWPMALFIALLAVAVGVI